MSTKTKRDKNPTAKLGKSKTKNLDKGNAKETIRMIVESKKEVKWKLPQDVKSLKAKRAFRQKYRNELRNMESALLKSPTPKLHREYKSLRKQVLLVP